MKCIEVPEKALYKCNKWFTII